MKFFKSSIFASIALATLALTGCSDDEKYVVGADSNGAYFATGQATAIEASYQESVYEIPVYRVSADSPSSYTVNVSISPAEDAITIPTTVSFEGSSLKTYLPISYDADRLELDKKYTIKLSLDNASDYGDSSYTFTFACVIPKVSAPWDGSIPATDTYPAVVGRDSHGTGTFTLSQFWSGDMTDLKVHKEYNPNVGESTSFDVVVENMYDVYGDSTGLDIRIEIPDLNDRDDDGNIYCQVGCGDINYSVSSYGQLHVADAYHWYRDVGNRGEDTLKMYGYDKLSTFNPNTGTFKLYLTYYVEQGAFAMGYETFVLDGYPDCTIGVEYKGLFQDYTADNFVSAVFTAGSDVASIRAAAILTSSIPSDLATASSVVEAASNVTSLDVSDSDITANFRIEDSGYYVIVGVAYDENNVAQDFGYSIARVELKDGDEGWVSLGQATYCDGWFAPIFTNYPNMYKWDIEIRQNKKDPKSYRMVLPYCNENFLNIFGYYNSYSYTKRNIDFYVYNDNHVEFQPQLSGVGYDRISDEEFAIANYEGYFYALMLEEEPNATASSIRNDVYDLIETYDIGHSVFNSEDLYVKVPVPLLYMGASYDWMTLSFQQDDGSYSAINPSTIILPESNLAKQEAKVRKARAKAIAKPELNNISSAIKASQLMGNSHTENFVRGLRLTKNQVPHSIALKNYTRK